jgi:hypothetical protein
MALVKTRESDDWFSICWGNVTFTGDGIILALAAFTPPPRPYHSQQPHRWQRTGNEKTLFLGELKERGKVTNPSVAESAVISIN